MNESSNDSNTLTTVCDAMASVYRRQVLRYLAVGENDVVSVEDLVDKLIDHDETADDRRRIAIKLHHVALPKLADAGFIEYDTQTQTARPCEHQPMEWHAFPVSVEDT